MDSRSGFALILVVLGIGGMWLLVTGKIQKFIEAQNAHAAAAASTDSSAGQPAGGSYGTWGPPANGGVSLTRPPGSTINPSQPLAPAALAYGVRLGGDGLAIEPMGAVRVLG